MRRGSSTVVSLVGAPNEGVLAGLGRVLNVATVGQEGEGLDAAIAAMNKVGGIGSPFVVTTADPLEEIAAEWRAMWDPAASPNAFEERAGLILRAWRAKRFELPDYYLVVASQAPDPDGPHHDDFHLGVLRSERPGRVAAIVGDDEHREEVARVLTALSHLPQGPWWPPLDQLVERARRFFPGGLAEGA